MLAMYRFRKPHVVSVNACNDGTGAPRIIERICIGYVFKKVFEPVIARGEITHEILDACTEMGRTIAAPCVAGICLSSIRGVDLLYGRVPEKASKR